MAEPFPAKESLLYLFYRPTEPITFPKGDKQVIFNVPTEYLSARHSKLAEELENRFGGESRVTIPIKLIELKDSLSIPMQLSQDDQFSPHVPYHRELASHLIQVFLNMESLDDLLSMAVCAYERCNPYLFNYAYSVALLHRPDTKDVRIPQLNETFPAKFFSARDIGRARAESFLTSSSREPIIIPMDYTATDQDIEHRVAYFREDIGVNLHHWHWHLVYPISGTREVVDKDRRGELFFYMHQQIIARYNFERFSNRLSRVKRMQNFREPIPEAYFPKLDDQVASRKYASRQANSYLKDLDRERERIKFDIRDLERWENRIFDVIHTGNYIDENNKRQRLTEEDGINILGNMVEASMLTVNRQLYGDMHNLLHTAISLCHDPDHRYLETFQVLADPSTAMRDPAFYPLHAYIDDIFQEHKATLPPYTVAKLAYEGVTVTSMEVRSADGNVNQFSTYWKQDDVNLSKGLDFMPGNEELFARITHLQHADFTYIIKASNKGKDCKGTVRIFLAPTIDERGVPLQFREQKNLFIELDKFTVDLKPGDTEIHRQSTESSITIPFEQTFRRLPRNSEQNAEFNFCGCGWPQHMLIPKGWPEGMPCQLFVMISNYKDDKVDQKLDEKTCSDASSFCGLRDKKYPDRRPMGYPFDRSPRAGVVTLQDFMNGLPNMWVIDVTINFNNRIEEVET
ncbi:phenoloxidase 1 [Anabrus simplex]|uniref:phenoloxidase 1 n=1 Tax=Anabrus simplex TaxID=316456 RepID=UPI0035A284B7